MIIWIINSVLVILLILSLIINRNQYVRNSKYESYIEKSASDFFDILDGVREDISQTLLHIREIDQREMFEKDDDVGVIFQEISESIEKLNKKLEIYGEETEEEN